MSRHDPWKPSSDWRPLSDNERALLVALTSQDFVGAIELRNQIDHTHAQQGCGCGCGTINRGAPAYMQNNHSSAVGIHSATAGSTRYVSSLDYLGNLQSGMQPYLTSDKRRDWILALYETAFKEQADPAGYNFWRNDTNATCSVQKARDTVGTFDWADPRFLTVNATTSDPGKKRQIRLLYWSTLGRDPSSIEEDHWLGIYNAGTWGDVVYSLIFSSEFNTRCWSGASANDGDIC